MHIAIQNLLVELEQRRRTGMHLDEYSLVQSPEVVVSEGTTLGLLVDHAVLAKHEFPLDQFSALCEYAMKLGYKITDYVSATEIMRDYSLTEDQAMECLALIGIDSRRSVIYAAVMAAGYIDQPDDDEDDEDGSES